MSGAGVADIVNDDIVQRAHNTIRYISRHGSMEAVIAQLSACLPGPLVPWDGSPGHGRTESHNDVGQDSVPREWQGRTAWRCRPRGGGGESGDICCVIIASGRSQYNCRLVSQSCGVGRRWPKRDSVANICKLHVSLRRCLGSGFRRGLAGRRPTNRFASVGLGYLRWRFVVALPGGDQHVRPDPVVPCAQWTLGCATATARTAGLRPEKKNGLRALSVGMSRAVVWRPPSFYVLLA